MERSLLQRKVISYEECIAIIKIKIGKALGEDGINIEMLNSLKKKFPD